MRYFLFFLLISVSCNNSDTNRPVITGDSSSAPGKKESSSIFTHGLSDTALQSKIEDTLMKLPFVKKSHVYIDSFSNHQHGMAFITDTANGMVTVMAGYNGTERFETYYNFTIHPKTIEIKVLDAVTSEYISVAEYIKKNTE